MKSSKEIYLVDIFCIGLLTISRIESSTLTSFDGVRNFSMVPESNQLIGLETDLVGKINVADFVSYKNLKRFYHKCILGEGKCDGRDKTVQQMLWHFLTDDCYSCPEQLKKKISKIDKLLAKRYSKSWRSAFILKSSQEVDEADLDFLDGIIVKKKQLNENSQEKIEGTGKTFKVRTDQNGYLNVIETIPMIPTPLPYIRPVSSVASVINRRFPFKIISSPAPELISAMEIPTIPLEPTTSPGDWSNFPSSMIPQQFSAVESTIHIKGTTLKP